MLSPPALAPFPRSLSDRPETFGHDLPPLEAVENEDWGRDYVLQHFQKHTAEELAAAGLTWDDSLQPDT